MEFKNSFNQAEGQLCFKEMIFGIIQYLVYAERSSDTINRL